MRIGVGMTQKGVDPIDQPIADGMLHVLGFFVDLVPGQVQRLHQKQPSISRCRRITRRASAVPAWVSRTPS